MTLFYCISEIIFAAVAILILPNVASLLNTDNNVTTASALSVLEKLENLINNIPEFRSCSVVFYMTEILDVSNLFLSPILKVFMIFNNSSLTNIILPLQTPKLQQECSIVLYLYVDQIFQNDPLFSKDWLENIPGGFSESYHVIVSNQKQWKTSLEMFRLPPHIRLMRYSLFVVLNDLLTPFEIFQSDIWGRITQSFKHDKGENLLSKEHLFPNKANFHHAHFIWSYVANPIISQKTVDSYRKFRKPFHVVITPLVEISEFINATPIVKKINSLNHGIFDKATKKWTGAIGEVVHGNAHVTQGMLLTKERNDILLLSKTIDQDGLAFVTGPPKVGVGSIAFIFKSYEPLVWIAQLVIISTISVILVVSNGLKFFNLGRILKAASYAIKPTFEQAEDSTEYKTLIKNTSARILVGPWLLSTILLCTVFKTNLTSTLTSPTFEYEPQDFPSLAKAKEYRLKFHGMNETMAGVLFSTLKESGNSIVTLLNQRIVQYYEGRDDVKCVTDTQDGDFVCIGIRNLISIASYLCLTQENGEPLYQLSKDNLVSSPFVFGISKELPHIMDTINKLMYHYSESGTYNYFSTLFVRNFKKAGMHSAQQRRKHNKLLKDEKSPLKWKTHRMAIFNALFTLGIGFGFGIFSILVELCLFKVRSYITGKKIG